MNSAIGFPNIYRLDRDLSGGKCYPPFERLGPEGFEPNRPIRLRACLHEGEAPQVGEVTWGGLPHLKCKRGHNKMRDYMDRRVTPPKRVTSPIWGTPPQCKQALPQCCTQFKPFGNKTFCFSNFHII